MNSLASFGNHAANELQDLISDSMESTPKAATWKETFRVDNARLDNIRLNENERDIIVEGCKRLSAGDKEALLEIEKSFATEGYGVPAIAILILVVIVIVAVAARQ